MPPDEDPPLDPGAAPDPEPPPPTGTDGAPDAPDALPAAPDDVLVEGGVGVEPGEAEEVVKRSFMTGGDADARAPR